ncbi:MAG: tetratricopeptide repeat protein [Armatimonadetes bacterium]|nr:tetratricopeptide repeat protein [Armatimonadota bacterium]
MVDMQALQALWQARQYSGAERLLRQALAADSKDHEAWRWLGLTLLMLEGREGEAGEALRQAAPGLPRDASVPFNLGVALQRQGKVDEARLAYTRALGIDPGYEQARRALAGLGAPSGAAQPPAARQGEPGGPAVDPGMLQRLQPLPLPASFGRSRSHLLVRVLLFAAAFVVWGLLLGLVALLPDGHIRQAVMQRGPLPYVSVLLFAGVVVVAAFRYFGIVGETARVHDSKLLAALRDGPPALSHALAKCGEFLRETSPMIDRRLIRAVNCAVTARNRQELYVAAREVARHDEAASHSAYAVPKLLIWALPVSGFTGTLLGMSTAIGGFRQLAEAKNLQDFGGAVETPLYGLAVAFDTTLVALVLVATSMFLVAMVQRRERELLAAVDAEVAEAVLQRLELGQGEPRGWIDAALMVELWEGFNRIQQQLAEAVANSDRTRDG